MLKRKSLKLLKSNLARQCKVWIMFNPYYLVTDMLSIVHRKKCFQQCRHNLLPVKHTLLSLPWNFRPELRHRIKHGINYVFLCVWSWHCLVFRKKRFPVVCSFFIVTQIQKKFTATISSPSGPFEQDRKVLWISMFESSGRFSKQTVLSSRWFFTKPVMVLWICALYRQAIHVGTCWW